MLIQKHLSHPIPILSRSLLFAMIFSQILLQGCGFRLRGHDIRHDMHKANQQQIQQNQPATISDSQNKKNIQNIENIQKPENIEKKNNQALNIRLNDQNISATLKKQLLYEIDKTHFSSLDKNKFDNIELNVFDEGYREEIQVLNAQGQVREIKLIKSIQFSLRDAAHNQMIMPPQSIEVVSDFSVNEALILSKSTEKQRIIENLQKQLAHDLLLKSFYFLQSY